MIDLFKRVGELSKAAQGYSWLMGGILTALLAAVLAFAERRSWATVHHGSRLCVITIGSLVIRGSVFLKLVSASSMRQVSKAPIYRAGTAFLQANCKPLGAMPAFEHLRKKAASAACR